MEYPKRYIDDNDIERGYYVYAHVDRSTGKIFYVGKGCDDRGWSENRSAQWHSFIAALPEGYEVKLLHTDLTEAESLELEADEIENNGGCEVKGGTLLNRYPGDRELQIGVTFTMDEPLDQYPAATEAADAIPQFNDFTPKERVEACKKWKDIVGELWDKFDGYLEDKFHSKDKDLPDLYDTVQNDVSQIEQLAYQLERKKISYEEFCDNVPDMVEWLFDEMGECGSSSQVKRVKPILEAIKKWWCQFEIAGAKDAASDAYYEKVAEIEGLEGGGMAARDMLRQRSLAALEQLKNAE